MSSTAEATLIGHLVYVYGDDGDKVYERVMEAIKHFKIKTEDIPAYDAGEISEKDVILITYGDFNKGEGYPPLQTLAEFLGKYLKDQISIVHILPFYPYSSDDGFSVIDYRAVNPELGSWEDVQELSKDYKLMFDAVINHISCESDWFKGFVEGDER